MSRRLRPSRRPRTGAGPIEALFDRLATHPEAIAVAVGLLAFVESLALVGIVTPGIALLAVGAAAAGAAGVPLSSLLVAGWLGAVAGDGLSFIVGHRYGPALRGRTQSPKVLSWLERGEHFFGRHGVAGVVLGRFLGPLRPVIPLVAGMLRMDPRLFFAVNLVTAVAWSPAYLLPGYLIGASLGQDLEPPGHWPWVLLLACCALWAGARLVASAWRLGARDGTAGRAAAAAAGPARWLAASLTRSGGADTRLSLLLAAACTVLLASGAAALLAVPAAAPWRAFAGEVLAMITRLW